MEICFRKKNDVHEWNNRCRRTRHEMLIKRHGMRTITLGIKKQGTCSSCYSASEKVAMNIIEGLGSAYEGFLEERRISGIAL